MVWVSVGIMFWMAVKKIVDEKSSFGNGWRFFYALKERGDRLWREYVRQGLTGRWRSVGLRVIGSRVLRKYVRRCLTGQCRQEGS